MGTDGTTSSENMARKFIMATMPFVSQGSWKNLVTTGVLGVASANVVQSTIFNKVPSIFSEPAGVKYALLDVSGLFVIASNMGLLNRDVLERIARYLLVSNIVVMGPYILLHEADNIPDRLRTLVNGIGLIRLAVNTPSVVVHPDSKMIGFVNTTENWKWVTAYTLLLHDQHMTSDGYTQQVEALITLWTPYVAAIHRGSLSDWFRDRSTSLSFTALTATTDEDQQRVLDHNPESSGDWTTRSAHHYN